MGVLKPHSSDPAGSPSPQTSFRSALILYAFILVSLLVPHLFLLPALSPANLIIVIGIISSGIVLAWCVASRGEILRGLTNVPPIGWLLAAVGLAGVTFGTAMLVGAVLERVFQIPVLNEEMIAWFHDAGYGHGVIVLVICVQPAVIEELAFRGVILSGLRRVLSVREAVVVSAFLFAIMHVPYPQFVPHLFLMGLMAGYLRVRTGSLIPCMILHFTHNFLVIVTVSAMK